MVPHRTGFEPAYSAWALLLGTVEHLPHPRESGTELLEKIVNILCSILGILLRTGATLLPENPSKSRCSAEKSTGHGGRLMAPRSPYDPRMGMLKRACADSTRFTRHKSRCATVARFGECGTCL